MTGLETSSLHQKAVLWSRTGHDANGEPVVSNPVEISCRWERSQREMLDEQDTTIAIDREVWVDRDIAVGSMLWEGALKDLPSPATGILQVIAATKIPDIKGRVFERTVLVRRYKESLPTVA